MTRLREVVEYLDAYLAIGEIDDQSWNALQYEGRPEEGRGAFNLRGG